MRKEPQILIDSKLLIEYVTTDSEELRFALERTFPEIGQVYNEIWVRVFRDFILKEKFIYPVVDPRNGKVVNIKITIEE